MTSAELRKFAREQLRALREDINDAERRMKHGAPHDIVVDSTCHTVRRLIENRISDLTPIVRADD